MKDKNEMYQQLKEQQRKFSYISRVDSEQKKKQKMDQKARELCERERELLEKVRH